MTISISSNFWFLAYKKKVFDRAYETVVFLQYNVLHIEIIAILLSMNLLSQREKLKKIIFTWGLIGACMDCNLSFACRKLALACTITSCCSIIRMQKDCDLTLSVAMFARF